MKPLARKLLIGIVVLVGAMLSWNIAIPVYAAFVLPSNAELSTIAAGLPAEELAGRLNGWRAVLDDRSLVTSLVAIQGPRAAGILASLTDVDLAGHQQAAFERTGRGRDGRGFHAGLPV